MEGKRRKVLDRRKILVGQEYRSFTPDNRSPGRLKASRTNMLGIGTLVSPAVSGMLPV